MCFEQAEWKREEIPDHKFDHVDVKDFHDESLSRKLMYMTVFAMTLKAILVYAADVGAVFLVMATYGVNNVLEGNINGSL
jgi:quinol-cytochrome oxidoreductase complex cytochrome b subunit